MGWVVTVESAPELGYSHPARRTNASITAMAMAAAYARHSALKWARHVGRRAAISPAFPDGGGELGATGQGYQGGVDQDRDLALGA